MLHGDEDVMTMFSMFEEISRLTCLELYITNTNTPTQTCANPSPISISSLNLEGFDEYLSVAMNLESIFEKNSPKLFDCYFIFNHL